MIVFSHYPADPRVRREREALEEAGFKVDVICLQNEDQARYEKVNGVGVYRLPVKRKRGGKIRYLWEYALFIMLAFFQIAFLHLRKFYKIIHVHNMPDLLVFSSLIPRIFGAKVIIDLHDPMPEVFMTKYDMPSGHNIIRMLMFFEKWSIRFSHLVITPNSAFREMFISRGCPAWKIDIIMNSPQESIFLATQKKINTERPYAVDSFIMMFHGTIVERHGLATALKAVDSLKCEIPQLRFEVFGEGDFVKPFLGLIKEMDLQDIVHYHGFVPMETISAIIPHIDVGIIPNLRSVFTEINLPTRIFEYLCMGKPVIAQIG